MRNGGYPKMEIVILYGFICSGKSFAAKEYEKQGFKIISFDKDEKNFFANIKKSIESKEIPAVSLAYCFNPLMRETFPSLSSRTPSQLQRFEPADPPVTKTQTSSGFNRCANATCIKGDSKLFSPSL